MRKLHHHQDRRSFLAAVGAVAAGAAVRGAQAQAKPLRLGLIGAGGRGSHLAATAVRLAQEGEPIELAAICDLYQPRLERAETRFKAKGYARTEDMLRDANLDAVIIATPDRHHVYNIREAIRAGKDVYCEKPLTHWAQFEQLKALVHENRQLKRVVQIGTQYVADSVWETAGEMIRNGAIGKPVHAQTSYFRRGDQGEAGMPIDDPNARPGVGLDWERAQADAPRRPFTVSRFFQWRLYADYSGGPVTDTYPHMLTPLLKTLNPGFPRKVVAVGGRYYFGGLRDVPDTFDLLIQYPQDLTVVFMGTFVNSTGIDTVVRGSEATMLKKQNSIVFEPQGAGKTRQEIPAAIPSLNEGHDVLTQAHLKDFFECVRTRRKPRGDLELAYTVQVPLLMAMQSHLENKVAFFDAEKEEIRLG
jgi:predicted dehydrogenase